MYMHAHTCSWHVHKKVRNLYDNHSGNSDEAPQVQVQVMYNVLILDYQFKNDIIFVMPLQQKPILHILGRKSLVYELTGIIVYKKLSQSVGHYTAFFLSSKNTKQWFYANDSQVCY